MTSYIDDIVVEHRSFKGSVIMAMIMVYEAAALNLYFKIPKCSFFPKHVIKNLETIVDLVTFTFSVSESRSTKIETGVDALRSVIRSNW